MIIRWWKSTEAKVPDFLETCKEQEQITGVKILSRITGRILIGGTERKPIFRDGIELDIDEINLTLGQLIKLNKLFPGYNRDYSVIPFKTGEVRDLEAEIDELKVKARQ